MGQIEALQKELAELREENKQLIFWSGFTKQSIRDLVALAEEAGQGEKTPVKTARKFLANEDMKQRAAA